MITFSVSRIIVTGRRLCYGHTQKYLLEIVQPFRYYVSIKTIKSLIEHMDTVCDGHARYLIFISAVIDGFKIKYIVGHVFNKAVDEANSKVKLTTLKPSQLIQLMQFYFN